VLACLYHLGGYLRRGDDELAVVAEGEGVEVEEARLDKVELVGEVVEGNIGVGIFGIS
jgi:hypothetical protein